MDKDKIRVQAIDFTSDHFDISPVWEFAIDEEGNEGQDETTLKPRLDIMQADPSEGMLIVECEFETNSGKLFRGFCTPAFDDSIGDIQPTILVETKMISFWHGINKPDESQKRNDYHILGETPETLFPIKFQSKLAKPDGNKITGRLNGFMWMTLKDRSVMTER